VSTLWEVGLAVMGVCWTLFQAAFVWVLYIALEPFVRRRNPRLLITWTRLVSGEWRDPLVGRDVLVGCAAGLGMVLASAGLRLSAASPLWSVVRHRLGHPESVRSNVRLGFHHSGLSLSAGRPGSPGAKAMARGAGAVGAFHWTGAGQAQFSPDGRWLAYAGDDSGRSEVYLGPVQGPGGRLRVSTVGGTQPRWRADGRELFFLAPDRTLMVVSVVPGGVPALGLPQRLFPAPVGALAVLFAQYDVTPDGQRFLVVSEINPTSQPVTLVLNWTAR
jgi:hypothetical protein